MALASQQTDGERVVVYPSEQKYVQTQFGVYEHLMSRFRDHILGPSRNNMLICLGYSFNDEHINEAICDAASSSASNLTVIGFIGSETDLITQQGRLEAIATRCPSQISFYVGNKFFVGDALSSDDSNALLAMDLWKFENTAEMLGGQ